MATVGPISQYEILRKIARGGMGEVYLARQRGIAGFAKEVVIKRIHSELAEDPAFVDMFLQEARIAALLDHPNIVLIYELGKQGNDYFIVMEYVRGLSLSRLMKAAKDALPVPFAIQIAAGVAAGLQFAHEQRDARGQPLNLVHRDISPPNVLVSTAGSVKITDFGIAKIRQSVTHTQAGVIKGKYSYIAPEQARGQTATPRSDIYSLGLVLYEMTTGQRAYPAGVDKEVLRAVANGQVAPPELYVTNYPEDLRAVLMRALEPDPRDRYQECQQLQEELLALLVNRQIVTSPAKLGQFVQQFVPERAAPARLRGDEAAAPAALGALGDEEAELGSDPAGSETAELGSRRSDLPTDEVLDVAPILRPDEEEDLPPRPDTAPAEPPPQLPDFDDDAETIMLDRKNRRPEMVQALDTEEPTTPAEQPPPEVVVALPETTEPPPPEAIDALLEAGEPPPPEAIDALLEAGEQPPPAAVVALPEPAGQPPPEAPEPAEQPLPASASSALADLILLEEMSGPGQEPAEQASAPSSWDQELAARGEPEAETEAAGSLTGAAGEVSVATRLPSPALPWVLPISAMVVAGAVVTWLLVGRDTGEKPKPPPAAAAPDVAATAPDARPAVPGPAVEAEPDASTPDLEPTVDHQLAPDAAVRRPPRGRPARTAPQRRARPAVRRAVRRRPPPRVTHRPARPIGDALTVKVSVTTEPPTDVYLEGRHLGRTPLTANIPPSDGILAFKNRALGVLTTRPISPRGTQLSVRFVFRKGTLRFDVPEGRMVYLDGKYLGLSPIPPTPVYEGAHKVTVVDLKTKRKQRHRLMVGPKETVQVGP